MSEYKDTILLPKTAFPMKANLPQNEPQQVTEWLKKQTYQQMVRVDTQGKTPRADVFVMPDGPPYANGNIHVGHVLNKVLKDIVIKYQNLAGRQALFIPGWDCHGLPIELKVTKRLGQKRQEMSDQQVREECRQEALHWVEIQKGQFQRLGVFADWDNPYLTLSPDYEAEEIRTLAKILDNGILYRGEKPVFWCPTLQTALAAAEVEYRNHKSPSVYVAFPVTDQKTLSLLGSPKEPVSIVIWTTTPWTLPANYGIALHPDLEYGLYKSEHKHLLLIATGLKESVESETGLQLQELKKLKGQALEGGLCRHPFLDRDSQIVLGEHVSLEAGTGCVHTAPGHGMDDYIVGMKYGLPIHSPVNEAGRFTEDVPEFSGLKIWEANPLIIKKLEDLGLLLGHKEIEHSYPHNPRSKTPLIFRATPQWFIRLDDPKYNLREKALKAAESNITFIPQWGSQRLISMISNSPDWCLSRQRLWGVPIPVFYCQNCSAPLVDSSLMNKIADLMEETGQGIEAYFSKSEDELLNGQQCQECGHPKFKKGQDILDVWFDSGICHAAVQNKRPGMKVPADIYLEGSDQHRGWFQTSLLSSLAANDKIPFKALVTHGFVNDSQGYKMSKSQGNVVDPAQVMKTYGAEILRLWVAHEDYGQDLTCGEEMLKRLAETYRRFRNTFRFMLGNLHDFDPHQNSIAVEQMTDLDLWALGRLNQLISRTTTAYENYEFYKVYHLLNNFFTVELSATYLDILKDRLYTWKADGLPRRSAQTVIYHMLHTLTGLMAPITSFLAEEVYGYIPGKKPTSVFLTDFPKVQSNWQNSSLDERFHTLLEVRTVVSKTLEDLRKSGEIGSSLDAKVIIHAPPSVYEALKKSENDLREFLIVSQFEIATAHELTIEAGKAEGTKCVRCWHYSPQTGNNTQFPEVCPKCVEALK